MNAGIETVPPAEAEDFWVASGHHLVDRNESGGLVLTDDFLKAYLARPELVPPPEACPVERGLHAALLAEPRRPVEAGELALMADADARENLGLFLAFRDRLLAQPTLEAAYLSLVTGDLRALPPLFLQHLTHIVARNAFDAEADPRVLRAAECFFRPQRVTFHEGSVLLADEEAISGHEADRHASPLLGMLGGPAVTELEVLGEANAQAYKSRSDGNDFVFDLTHPTHGRAALGRALSRWISHLLGLDIPFRPVDSLEGEPVVWFLGLDADGTAIGNRLWKGEAVSDADRLRVLALYLFDLPDDPRIDEGYRGRRGFAILGSDGERLVRLKPQNLVAGLPLARPA